jgi:hypothetical protein
VQLPYLAARTGARAPPRALLRARVDARSDLRGGEAAMLRIANLTCGAGARAEGVEPKAGAEA